MGYQDSTHRAGGRGTWERGNVEGTYRLDTYGSFPLLLKADGRKVKSVKEIVRFVFLLTIRYR